MSKLRVPLLSFQARGSVADTLTYTQANSIHIVKRIPKHFDANTQAQRDHREKFIECIEHWRELSDEEKAAYESQARPYHLTGYQYYMSLNIMTVWCPPYTLYEECPHIGVSSTVIYGATYRGETFTPQHTHTIYRLKLKLYRIGNPGDLTITICETDVGEDPVLPSISQASFPEDTFPDDPTLDWYDLDFPSASLKANDVYAFYYSIVGGDVNNCYHPAFESIGGTYTRGNSLWSGNAGVDWMQLPGTYLPFQDWGCPGND